MNAFKHIAYSLLALIFSISTYAQEDCEVLVPELVGSYVGKCKNGKAHGHGKAVGVDKYEGSFKKGLPHGDGVYNWAGGAVYDGRWVYGLREGEGVYKFSIDGKDSIQDGIWKQDEFKGAKVIKPKVIRKEYIQRYNFRREGDGNRILIDITLNGSTNSDILDLSIMSSSGSSFKLGRSHGLDDVIFPIVVKVSYLTWNPAHTSRHTASFEFEITEPGKWQVNIAN